MIAETHDRELETQDVQQRDQLAHSLTQLKTEKAELERQLAEKEQLLKEGNAGDFRIIKTEEHRPLAIASGRQSPISTYASICMDRAAGLRRRTSP